MKNDGTLNNKLVSKTFDLRYQRIDNHSFTKMSITNLEIILYDDRFVTDFSQKSCGALAFCIDYAYFLRFQPLFYFFALFFFASFSCTEILNFFYIPLQTMCLLTPFSYPKARFRRRTFHEPNRIRIKANPNYLDRLN